MDLLFKNRGLLRNDISTFPDLRANPSFFAIEMGVGFGNRNLTLPSFEFNLPEELFGDELTHEDLDTGPMELKFRAATAVGVEGAYFINPYVGFGGRLRVKSTPIKGWSAVTTQEQNSLYELMDMPEMQKSITNMELTIESDHITEFAADLGVYFSLPLSSRFALGTKALVGRSVMDDIEVKAECSGTELEFNLAGMMSDDEAPMFLTTDRQVDDFEWRYLSISASNSMKFGTGVSLTYAHKNSFSWRVFLDYDYARKTYKAAYNPMGFMDVFCPSMVDFAKILDWDMTADAVSSVKKSLHQWVLGGALCVSF